MKKLMRLIVLLPLVVGLNNLAFADRKPSTACLEGKVELIESCLDEAYTKWDKKLNDTYKNVMGYLAKDKKAELRNQQRAWLKERAKKCDGLSSEHAIKVCNLDEAQLKALALEDQEADLMPKLFEGDWRAKYGSEKEYEGNYGAYDGFLILQKGKNVCGTWMFFSTGYYEGLFHARLENPNTAQTIEACGRQYSHYTKTEWCNDVGWKNLSEDDKTYLTFKICSDNKLYHTVADKKDEYQSYKGFTCSILEKTTSKGLKRKKLSNEDKSTIIKANPAIRDCLNYKN